MKRTPSLASVLILLILAGPLQAVQWKIEDLFQKGLLEETVERKPDSAIRIYQQVIDQSAGDRAIAAEARLRIGICFEKLGKLADAQQFYAKVAKDSGATAEVNRQARANLQRVEAQLILENRETPEYLQSPTAPPLVYVRRFRPLRYSLVLGPSWIASAGGTAIGALNAGLRYRISAPQRPQAWYLEFIGTPPIGSSEIGNQSESFDTGTDHASLTFKYQASLGVVAELPRGKQTIVTPELGAGLALTASEIRYIGAASSGEKSYHLWSPYVQTGLRFFPEHIVSGLFQLRYITEPYAKTVEIPSPAHSQTFDFPSSAWSITLGVQIKFGTWDLIRETQP